MNINEIIKELETLQQSVEIPWYMGDITQDEYGNDYCGVGPYDMSEKIGEKHPYEDCIANFKGVADFLGSNTNCEANVKYAVAAVNAVPMLIERIKELERKTSTELSDDVNTALEALEKWRKCRNFPQ